MTYFEDSFYTNNFDQEIMDFIEKNFKFSQREGELSLQDEYLKYHPEGIDYFWTSNLSKSNFLTKEQFKEKIGMVEKDNNVVDKGILKTGMIVEVDYGDSPRKTYLATILLNTEHGDILSGDTWGTLEHGLKYIKKVYQPSGAKTYLNYPEGYGLTYCDLIWQRKSPEQLEIEKLEDEKDALQKRIDELKEKL